MKVYAEFKKDEGLLFRTKTLLQYGDSWDLIGSIVMKNPGSAKPGSQLSEDAKNDISAFYEKNIDFDHWTSTDADATMKDILPIFNGNYVNKKIDLNGVIQIYNLLNVCDPSVDSAYKKTNQSNSKFLFPIFSECEKEFKNKPIYLGFGNFYTNRGYAYFHKLRDLAKEFFEYIKRSEFDYLEDDYLIDEHFYHKNFFYHPQFINKPTKREKYLPVLDKFIKLFPH
ncbi:hypothetical protein [Sphingobacterium sp. LRF_L2]|uniref:hypothetical protein n=1 Tax=Sphingobacterium sp. LRF_L2 TaxID=3369421 RepID=UPI003F60C1FD